MNRVAKDYIDSNLNTDSIINSLLSNLCKADEEMLPAPATVGNKLVPDQAVNTTLEVLVQPVNESFASAFVE